MGKNTVEAPDYAPLATASAEAARIQSELGREQLAFARDQYERTAPMLESIANQQMQAQAEQIDQARDYYNYQRDVFRPLERSIVQDAQDFNTEAYREQLASQAAADAGKLAIGVDSNQNGMAPGSVLTSMLKRVDVAAYETFKDAMSGSFSSGVKVLGVAEGGVDWALDENNASLVTAGIKSAVEKARSDILSGKVVVHDFMSDSKCPY